MLASNALAVGAGAVALTLTGCAVPRTTGYAYPMPQYYSPGVAPPRVVVMPRQSYPQPVMAQPYTPQPFRAQPAAVEKPAVADPPTKAEPSPLIEVDRPYSHRVDDSCVGYWRICHFL